MIEAGVAGRGGGGLAGGAGEEQGRAGEVEGEVEA